MSDKNPMHPIRDVYERFAHLDDLLSERPSARKHYDHPSPFRLAATDFWQAIKQAVEMDNETAPTPERKNS